MKKNLLLLLSASLLLIMPYISKAQIILDESTNTVTTNFNGWNGTLPTGFTTTGSYIGDGETTNTGGLYAVSGMGFGYQGSGTVPTVSLTGTYKNESELPITSIDISYEAFQIYHRDSRIPIWKVFVNGVEVPALQYTYANDAAVFVLSANVTGLSIAPNATFTIRFQGLRGETSGSSPKIGLNNVYVKAYSAGVPLPVQTSSLTAFTEGDANTLAWQTYSMDKNVQFSIERSNDGQQYQSIHTIEGALEPMKYNYVDASPIQGWNYYRIAIMKGDEKAFTNTVKLFNQNSAEVAIYPNPAQHQIILRNIHKNTKAAIYNVNGIKLADILVSENNNVIDIKHLPAGQYIIQLENSTTPAILKFVKQ